jgi:hypothetical protein
MPASAIRESRPALNVERARPSAIPAASIDEWSTDEQIDYAQSLWDRIAAAPELVPIPESHREVLDAPSRPRRFAPPRVPRRFRTLTAPARISRQDHDVMLSF